MSALRDRLARNVATVCEQIERAVQAAGRRRDEIELVATTKYVDSPVVRELVGLNVQLLGESRPQDLWRKAAELSDLGAKWHLIGHLQRNKIRRTLPLVTLIHSVDSERLLAGIDEEGALRGRPASVLLEVNISGDMAKHGFAPDELEPILTRADQWPYAQIRGLMGMASLTGGPAQARRDFAALRALRDQLQPVAPASVSLTALSMGMSSDFAEAILEGATLVRIGSALFEGIEK